MDQADKNATFTEATAAQIASILSEKTGMAAKVVDSRNSDVSVEQNQHSKTGPTLVVELRDKSRRLRMSAVVLSQSDDTATIDLSNPSDTNPSRFQIIRPKTIEEEQSNTAFLEGQVQAMLPIRGAFASAAHRVASKALNVFDIPTGAGRG